MKLSDEEYDRVLKRLGPKLGPCRECGCARLTLCDETIAFTKASQPVEAMVGGAMDVALLLYVRCDNCFHVRMFDADPYLQADWSATEPATARVPR